MCECNEFWDFRCCIDIVCLVLSWCDNGDGYHPEARVVVAFALEENFGVETDDDLLVVEGSCAPFVAELADGE